MEAYRLKDTTPSDGSRVPVPKTLENLPTEERNGPLKPDVTVERWYPEDKR